MAVVNSLELAPGIVLRREYLSPPEQKKLVAEVLRLTEVAPFYRPQMPRSGKPFSVEETNFGSLGWLSEPTGYRYSPVHPATGAPWPSIPAALLDLWGATANYAFEPECCLVNLYRNGARMGAHQDRDEEAVEAPVVSVSLGDAALFRFGGANRSDSTKSVKLMSGDVLTFGGPARLMYHGIDRVLSGSSSLVPGGGRLNLTLRRVARPQKNDARSGGRPGA
jgi:alkylated DNA repair protein (DNA oxidative demethylase)